jgi:hypothetical protein
MRWLWESIWFSNFDARFNFEADLFAGALEVGDEFQIGSETVVTVPQPKVVLDSVSAVR